METVKSLVDQGADITIENGNAWGNFYTENFHCYLNFATQHLFDLTTNILQGNIRRQLLSISESFCLISTLLWFLSLHKITALAMAASKDHEIVQYLRVHMNIMQR